MTFMTGAFVDDRRRALLRHALGLHRRGRLRDLDAGRRRRADRAQAARPARGEADRPGRARFAAPRGRASASTATTSTPRRRRSRPGSAVEHRQASAAREGGFPGAAVIQKQLAEGAPRKRVGILPEGKATRARGRGDRDRPARSSARSRRRLRARRSARAVAMGYVERAACRPTAPRSSLLVRGKPRAGRDRAHALRQARYYRGCRRLPMASIKYTKEHEWIRVEGDVGTVGITAVRAGAAGRRGLRRACPQAGRKVAKGEAVRGGRIGQGRDRHLRPGLGRGGRGQRRARRRRRATSTPTPMGKGWFFKIKLANRPSSTG